MISRVIHPTAHQIDRGDPVKHRICLRASNNRALTAYAGNMTSDKVVFTNSEAQAWRPVRPGSLGQTVWSFACAKP